jgi:hypothetical protein
MVAGFTDSIDKAVQQFVQVVVGTEQRPVSYMVASGCWCCFIPPMCDSTGRCDQPCGSTGCCDQRSNNYGDQNLLSSFLISKFPSVYVFTLFCSGLEKGSSVAVQMLSL